MSENPTPTPSEPRWPAIFGFGIAFLYLALSHYTSVLPDILSALTAQLPATLSPKLKLTLIGTGYAFFLGFVGVFFYLRSHKLYSKILVAMIAGAFFGHLFGPAVAAVTAPLGTIFIRLLKMIVVPLVFASLTLGIMSLGDVRKIGRIGGKTLLYFTVTTALAILIGLVLVNTVRPGDYVAKEDKQKYEEQYRQKVQTTVEGRKFTMAEMVTTVVPTNPIEAMAKGDMLQVIFFALLFGLVLTGIPAEKKEVIAKALDGINDAMVKMVMWIMAVAPVGVFVLMADTVAKTGISVLRALAVYAMVVVVGLILQVVIGYGVLVRIFGKMGLIEFLWKTRAVALVAFSTSSSSATLPVTMRCAEEELGVPKETASFVLPLGATINMNGTALYLGVAAVFIAQVCGMSLNATQQLSILLAATISAIGTPGIPGGSIVFLAMILDTVGVPAMGIALILGVDRILDMCRTVLNVMGDLTATLFIKATERN